MTIATHGHDGRLTTIAQTRHVDMDDDTCAVCGGSGEVEDMDGFWTDCPCRDDDDAIQAEIDAELDMAAETRAMLMSCPWDPDGGEDGPPF